MTEDTQTHANEPTSPPNSFGSRLQTAREAMGLKRKDAAEQLRLNEKFIIMMEKGKFPVDLPITFIRGYLRAYSKLLDIPEYEVKKAIEPIKPKQTQNVLSPLLSQPAEPMTSNNYFMQLSTYMIVLTLLGLVGVWWYTHNTSSTGANPPLETTPQTIVTDLVQSPPGMTAIPVENSHQTPTDVVNNKPENATTQSTLEKSLNKPQTRVEHENENFDRSIYNSDAD